jgi:hypothetical protein
MTVVQREKSLEVDVWGHGKNYHAYAVDQRDIRGAVDNPYEGAWESLYRWIKSINGTWKDDGGFPFRVIIIGIVGDKAAERFTERWTPVAYYIRRVNDIRADSEIGFLKFRFRQEPLTVEISKEYYARLTAARLQIPGLVDAGEIAIRNLSLNLALADIWLDTQANLLQERIQTAGMDMPVDLNSVFENLERLRGNWPTSQKSEASIPIDKAEAENIRRGPARETGGPAMNITVDKDNAEAAYEAAKALEEIKKLIAGMGGQVYGTRAHSGFQETPLIRIRLNQVYMTLNIRFDATSLSKYTAQSSGQAGGTP